MTIALPTLFCTLELEHVFASGDVVDDGKKKQVEACQATFFKKWANPGLFLFIFVLFTNKFYRKNCRFQQDSNLDCRRRRRASC